MGLLTGFSIISGVEIVYFAIKIILKILKNMTTKMIIMMIMMLSALPIPILGSVLTNCLMPPQDRASAIFVGCDKAPGLLDRMEVICGCWPFAFIYFVRNRCTIHCWWWFC